MNKEVKYMMGGGGVFISSVKIYSYDKEEILFKL